MKPRWYIPLLIVLILIGAIYFGSSFSPAVVDGPSMEITRGPLNVWSTYEGKIEARDVKTVMSGFNGAATIVEIAPEGNRVNQGDMLVRFDCSSIERDLLKLDRDYELARLELEGLEHAQLPLEIRDLEIQLAQARADYSSEEQYLVGSKELLAEDLVSEQEIKQQELKVEQLQLQLAKLEMQLKLTKKYLHPSAMSKARATLASAEQSLNLARMQFQSCTVFAPSDGLVVYRPLHVGSEYRTVRVGDALHRNQPFMAIPDMSKLTVHCNVPEAELSRVAVGKEVIIAPLAYPDIELSGVVESIGTMAQAIPGKPRWQSFFKVVIKLNESREELRTGMSVHSKVRSYHNADALLVPRTAVWWEEDKPYCSVRRGRSVQAVQLTLGPGSHKFYEVKDGLRAGDTVVVP